LGTKDNPLFLGRKSRSRIPTFPTGNQAAFSALQKPCFAAALPSQNPFFEGWIFLIENPPV